VPVVQTRENVGKSDQGDFVLGDVKFVFLGMDKNNADRYSLTEGKTAGLAITTQICELQEHRCLQYVKVAAIVDLSGPEHASRLTMIRRGHNPNFAAIENLPEGLFVDLSQVMNVDRSWLEQQTIHVGFSTPKKLRNFQRQLGRNLARFGFPDEFNLAMQKVSEKLARTQSNPARAFGDFAEKVDEILVYSEPEWSQKKGSIWFILLIDPKFDSEASDLENQFRDLLETKFDTSGPYQIATVPLDPENPSAGDIFNVVCESTEDLTLKEYRLGRRLDLDYVSTPADTT